MQEPETKKWSVRPAGAADIGFLRDMLHEAVFVPAGEPRPPWTVLELPELRRYVDGFGSQVGDLGVIGEVAVEWADELDDEADGDLNGEAVGGLDGGVDVEAGGERVRRPVGACWVRQFSSDAPGYGWVGAGVPELSIAVVPDGRAQGLGAALIDALCSRVRDHGAARVSLSVDERSPARRLYERSGFMVVGSADGSLTMVRRLE